MTHAALAALRRAATASTRSPSAPKPGAAAAPGAAGAPPGPYRSPLLRLLRQARLAIPALLLLATLFGLAAVGIEHRITKTIGSDAEASVVAAERVRTGLAEAHAAFLAALARREGPDGNYAAVARQRTGEVMDALADAARNVTYGAEEENPIDTVLRGLATYAGLAGVARAGGPGAARAALDADRVMQWTLLPAAATLDRVNAEHLAADYDTRGTALLVGALWLAALAAAGASLVVLQGVVRARTRRQVSPPLAAATVVLALGALATLWFGSAAFHEMKVAKQDAFDSIAALWTARAVGADAEAAVNAVLVAPDEAARAAFARSYDGRSRTVLRTGDGVGLLGEELANVTFPGERDAAEATVKAWQAFDACEADVLARARRSDPGAVAAQTEGPKACHGWFRSYDVWVGRVIDVNAAAFATAIDGARSAEGILDALIPGTAILVAALALYGIKLRTDEYRA